jgi:mannosyltransferase
MSSVASSTRSPGSPWARAAILLLVLVAFTRVAWQLGGQDLWWDESLTLQRAESSLVPLLKNEIMLADGLSQVISTDQHPFFYFLLEAIFLRLAGNDEYAVRFVSTAASTLMVPVALVFAALYVRRGVIARTGPAWAALLAATSPFLLWFGQEARPYALWALLTLLNTYLLLRAAETSRQSASRWPWIVGYAGTLGMLLATHYYAIFVLPIQAILIYRAFHERNRFVGAIVGIAMLLVGILVAALAFWFVIVRQNAGDNFSHVSWKILLPDLLNAFSLGLSVDIHRVFLVDLLFGLLALTSAIWALRSRRTWSEDGWVPVAMVVVPVSAILVGDLFHPVYMTARHLSLLVGPFIVLVGAGLALAWWLRPSLAIAATLVILVFSGFSTYAYFTDETYAQEDISRLASDLGDRLAPGDLVLIKSPFAWRMFSYYQPKVAIRGTSPNAAGYQDELDVYGIPLLNRSWDDQFEFLDDITRGHRRIWLLVSGTQAHMDLDERVERWLADHLFEVEETTYFSQSSLKTHLYLREVPVYESVPDSVQNPVQVEFGDRIRLDGYDVGFPPHSDLSMPFTLYWEALQPMDRRYKFRVDLVEVNDDGTQRTISRLEQEPYRGAIPTIYWDPGKVIVEYAELPAKEWPQITDQAEAERYRLTMEVYDAETLEKLPVTNAGGAPTSEDGTMVILPYRPQ